MKSPIPQPSCADETDEADEAGQPREWWDARIREHDRRVLLSLLAMGMRPDRARELCQSTWIRLIEQDRQGQLGHLSFPGLAIRQARFLALDEIRRQASDRRRLAGVRAQSGGQTPVSPEAQAASRQQLEAAAAVLTDGPKSAREVFRLLYTPPPHSHEQTARALGLSVQRVRQIVCETRKRLRVALEESET